jgi:tetratricopeptide (TPR) repeat protein
MRRSWLGWLAALMAAPYALAVTDADRVAVYHEFRQHFDAHEFDAALPLAQRLVALTEEQYGEKAHDLAVPLTNLGTTYHRLGKHAEAEKAYVRCIQLLEAASSTTDRQLLPPLHGLGVTYVALGQFDNASLVLRRAVDLSRNLNGLFSAEQLAMLGPLIRSYVELGDYQNAEKEHQYAFEVAETTYGKDDPRLLEPIDSYARWFEFVGRYSTARALHARALSIAEHDGHLTPSAVDALRGIARTYRLEALNGSEDEQRESPMTPTDFSSFELSPFAMVARGFNPDGERALQAALQALEKEEPMDHTRVGETGVDLGDWYLSSGDSVKAMNAYRAAWKELQLGGSTTLLAEPRQLAYRPPQASVTRTRLEPKDADEHFVEVHFTVTPDGRTTDIATTASDAPEPVQKAVINAVKRARYGPRLEDGEPVAASDVALRERVVSKRKRR